MRGFRNILKKNKIQYHREIPLSSFSQKQNRRNIPGFIIENKIVINLKTKRTTTKDDIIK
jgi:hypothetical protein